MAMLAASKKKAIDKSHLVTDNIEIVFDESLLIQQVVISFLADITNQDSLILKLPKSFSEHTNEYNLLLRMLRHLESRLVDHLIIIAP